jgi:protein SCO1/2
MNWTFSIIGRCMAATAALLLAALCAGAQAVPSNLGQSSNGLPPALVNVGFEPPLNGQMPLDLAFRDETGRSVKLGDYFGQRPVLLAFVYYGCPMLCNQIEHGVVSSMKMVSFNPGREYEGVFVSFDPRETPDMAAKKKEGAVSRYGRPGTADGWHFLTGAKDSINAVTQAANFRYTFSEKTNLFAHASGIMILTPAGRISRYFYGVEYPTRDVRLGLVEASQGRIGAPIDRVLLFCYQYDPTAATYSASILKIIRLSGVFTVLLIIAGILIFRRREQAPLGSNLPRPPKVQTEQGAH